MNRHDLPLIAINGLLVPDETGTPAKLSLRNRYAEPILRAGGIPVAIPPVGGPRDLERLLDRVEGLVLTGGDDFATERLGLGTTHPKAVKTPARKQDFDIELARLAIERDLPVLGICYGMQCLVLAEGGSIFQHLPDDRPGCQEHTGSAVHAVRLERGSKLGAVLEVERLDVISRHHQAVSDPGPRWIATAHDDEDLVEGVERPGSAYSVGVQWHPELSPEGSPHDRLFRGLIDAAALRRPETAPTHR